jgi:hypothetical protein
MRERARPRLARHPRQSQKVSPLVPPRSKLAAARRLSQYKPLRSLKPNTDTAMSHPGDRSHRVFLRAIPQGQHRRWHVLAWGASAPALTAASKPATAPAPAATPVRADDSRRVRQLSAGEAVLRISHGEMTAERYAATPPARCESLRSLNPAGSTFPPALAQAEVHRLRVKARDSLEAENQQCSSQPT